MGVASRHDRDFILAQGTHQMVQRAHAIGLMRSNRIGDRKLKEINLAAFILLRTLLENQIYNEKTHI